MFERWRFEKLWADMAVMVSMQHGWTEFEGPESIRLQEVATMLSTSELAKYLWKTGGFHFGHDQMVACLPLIAEPIGAGIKRAVDDFHFGLLPDESRIVAYSHSWMDAQDVYAGGDRANLEVLRSLYLVGYAAGAACRGLDSGAVRGLVRFACQETGAVRDFDATLLQVTQATRLPFGKDDALVIADATARMNFPGATMFDFGSGKRK